MALHGNLINGEWITGADVNRDVNPSNLQEVVGEYARGDAAQAQAAIAAARAAFPGWSRGNRQERADLLDRTGDEISAARRSSGTLLSREEGKTLAGGDRRGQARGLHLQVLRGRGRAAGGGSSTPSAPACRWRSRASRSASSASSRPGTSRSPFPPGRSPPLSRMATASSSSRPTWCQAVLGPGGHPRAWRRAAGGVQPRDGARIARRRGADRLHRRRRRSASRAPWRRAGPSRRGRRPHGQGSARDGREEPARGPGRRGSGRRGELRGPGRLLLRPGNAARLRAA